VKQALIILFGIGVLFSLQSQEKPLPKDVKALTALAVKGDARAQAQLGFMYVTGKGVERDLNEAAKWFRKAAEQGHTKAQYNLGMMYVRGEGVERDFNEAAKWFTKAAEQGDAMAPYNLGLMYDKGDGVEKDYKEAAKWYRKAALQGHAKAQFNLGVRYEEGQGVEQDFKEAVKWYHKAADQGDTTAHNHLQAEAKKGSELGTEIEKIRLAEEKTRLAEERATIEKLRKLPDGKKTFVAVKGIHLGMNIIRATEVLNKKFAHLNLKARYDPKSKGATVNQDGIQLVSNEKGHLTIISFSRPACDTLFDTKGLPARRFAEEFAEGYKTGRMEFYSRKEVMTLGQMKKTQAAALQAALFSQLFNDNAPSDFVMTKQGVEQFNAKEGYRIEILLDVSVRDTGGNSRIIADQLTRELRSGADLFPFLTIKATKKAKFD